MASTYKVWADGDAFTAADAGTYLMRQVIIAVDNATDRDAILTPQEGMTVYREDTNTLETYDGASWVNMITNKAKVGTFVAPAATGNLAVTGVGFKPKLVRFTVVPTASSGTNSLSNQGVMDGAGNQWSIANASRHGVSESDTSTPDTTKCIKSNSQSAGAVFTTDLSAAYVSMDTDGFTVNFTVASSSYTVLWEAIG